MRLFRNIVGSRNVRGRDSQNQVTSVLWQGVPMLSIPPFGILGRRKEDRRHDARRRGARDREGWHRVVSVVSCGVNQVGSSLFTIGGAVFCCVRKR